MGENLLLSYFAPPSAFPYLVIAHLSYSAL